MTSFHTAIPVASGASGEVAKAWDEEHERWVALKFLRGTAPELEERMLREARAQSRVDHPNVCEVYGVGRRDGRAYIAMQFVDGRPIDEVAAELPIEERVRLVQQVAEAVHAAHREGLIHRDLKPGNILVADEDGELVPYVLDFGIVRELSAPGLTETGQVLGTPGYMSPEQIRADPAELDRRTDVFALGVLLYELVAGRRPFGGGSGADEMVRVLSDEDAPSLTAAAPGVPGDLVAVVHRCLEKDRSLRYDSARSLAEDLGRYLDGRPVQARPLSVRRRAMRWARRRRGLVAVVGLASVLVAVFAAWALHSRATARERARVAQRFGAEAERIGSAMRVAHLSPSHDIRPHRDSLLGRLEELERSAEALPRATRRPALLALARGHLALGRVEEARRWIERRWELGQGDEAVAVTYASILGELYRRELTRVERIGNADLREEERRRVQEELRAPALAALDAVDDESVPRLLQARIAFWEERESAALELAHVLRTDAPWLYEALLLEGDVRVARGLRLRREGDSDGAVEALEAAQESLEQAAEVGRSDPETWESLCRLGGLRLQMAYYDRDEALDPHLELVNETCGRALTIDGTSVEALVLRSRAWARRAEELMRRGEDPADALRRARADAEAALAVEPENIEALRSLGDALIALAEARLGRGEDPSVHSQEGVAVLERAVEIEPSDPGAWNSLGLAYWHRLAAAQAEEAEPEPWLTRGIEAFDRASTLRPTYSHALSNLGALLKQRMLLDVDEGKDPTETFDRARTSYRRALEVNPSNSYAMNNLGSLLVGYAEWRIESGDDGEEELLSALEQFDRAAELNSRWSFPPANAGLAWRQLALSRSSSGRGDAREAFERSAEELRRALELRPGFAPFLVELARVLADRAQWEAAKGAAPDRWLEEAEEVLRPVLRSPAAPPDADELSQRIERIRDAPRAPDPGTESAS